MRRQIAVWIALLVVAIGARAEEDLPLTLAEAEDLALHNEPGRAAFLARAEAFTEQSVAARQLPDPMLRIGLDNFPIDSGSFTAEDMTQAQLMLHQAFPPGKTRSASARQFRWMAAEMTENAAGRRRDVLTFVRQAWLETYYWGTAHSIAIESRPFFSDLATVTRSLYAVGRKNQQDVLRAELELSRLDDRIIDIGKQWAAARASLSQWLGDASSRPVAQTLPSWESVPALEALRAEVPGHPALQSADARIDASDAGVDLAKERFKPGWALDFGYAHRNGIMPDGRPRSDFVGLAVTVDLPLFRKNRQHRSLAAALSERAAATESREETRRQLVSRLDAEYARWQELTRQVDLYERQILSQAEDQARAALAAYQSDAGDFADVMRGYIDQLEVRLTHIRLQVDRAQSYAVLANLGGLPR